MDIIENLRANPDTSNISQIPNSEPYYLSEKAILIYDRIPDRRYPTKPPPSPTELLSDCYVTILPKLTTELKDIELPYVRELGIRDSINKLAPVFTCNDYKNNLVQFWLLDVIVDCIWKCQDEFRFNTTQQKWVLEWFLFILNLLSQPTITKARFFHILNDAIVIGQDYIESGGHVDPIPRNLFTINVESEVQEDECSVLSLHSSSFLDTVTSKPVLKFKNSRQHIVVKTASKCKVFKLPIKDETVNCLSSSEDPPSEQEIHIQESSDITIEEKDSESTIEFYRPNLLTPPRFKSLSELNKTSSGEISLEDDSQKEEQCSLRPEKGTTEWHNIPRTRSQPKCPSKQIIAKPSLPIIEEKAVDNMVYLDTASKKKTRSKSTILTSQLSQQSTIIMDPVTSIPSIKLTSDEIFKAFYDFNLWQLKNEYMASSKTGWVTLSSVEGIKNQCSMTAEPHSTFKINVTKHSLEEENQQFIKKCVLMAVRQIAFDYFENSFAFELARVSLSNPQFLLTQDINVEWNIPKEFKGEIKKPIPKKPKKEKAKKEPKKAKKEKSSKASSKSKKSGKDKKSKASDKKSKSSGKKGKSSDKKSKKSGREKVDKKELNRQKKEQEDLEKELIRQAENKMFMFPLKDAVSDKFFTNIFPNYKPKGKKAPAMKIEKESKASKDSKKEKNKAKGKKK